jgi:hypothetical protein
MADFHIPESHVQHAFDLLKSGQHAVARAAYEFAEKQLKVVLAKAAAQSNATSIAAREAEALRSPEYERALDAFKAIAETYYREKDRREAAAAIIDAWRTQQSDLRAMGRAA